MSKEKAQLNLNQLVSEVENFLSSNKNYKIIFGEFMVPGLVGGYTDDEYEVDKFLSKYLKGYYNQRAQYLDVFKRIINSEVKTAKVIKEEGLEVESLIHPDLIIDEVETVKLGNGFLENGQFKADSDKLFIHRISTNYYHQLEPKHQRALECWETVLDWMTQGNEEEIRRLQEFFSSVFLVQHKDRKAFSQFGLFGGASGSGKSTLFKIISNAIGSEKAVDLKLEEFSDDNKLKEANNKLLVIDHELDTPIKGKKASNIKQGAEGGEFLINSKYVEAYPMRFSGTVVLATNKDFDYIVPYEERNGLNRRLQTFWFDYPITDSLVPMIAELLNDETDIVNEVVLHWLVKGYLRLTHHNFNLDLENEIELPIGQDASTIIFPNSTWEEFSVYWGLIKVRRRVDGERKWIIEKDPRGPFTDYITYSEVYNQPIEQVVDLLKSRGWDEGKKVLNQRILHHFSLEGKRVRRDGKRVRIYTTPEQTNSSQSQSQTPQTTTENDYSLVLGF